jgi:DNA invertase Pin-like site-specific DNA recombinase
MPYDRVEVAMGKRELIAWELDRLHEQDLDKLLALLRSLQDAHIDSAMPALAAQSSLAKDWLTPEEDATWANL